jgi:hypothetical protein
VNSTPPNPVADELLAQVSASPDAYPQKIDLVGLAVLLVQFSPGAYRAASFLDDRILGVATKGAWLPLERIAGAARGVVGAKPLHFIFHTGHVGSTLVTRLLDETGMVLSLREPLPLRTLAEAHDALGRAESLLSEGQFSEILDLFLRLWSRGYDSTSTVVIKATSSAGRLAAPILAGAAAARAIYLNMRPEPYLATLLAGANSPLDLRGHGPERIRRLQARRGVPVSPLHALSLGELAAMSWLVESWTQRDAALRWAGRVLPVDFEAFLADVEDGIRRVAAHFELSLDDRQISAVAGGVAMARYSKAPEYAYSAALRAQILDDARRNHRDEIRKGMAWLERMAREDSAASAVVNA